MHSHNATPTSSSFTYPTQQSSHGGYSTTLGSEINSIVMSHTLHSPVYTRPQQLGYKANSPLSTSEQLMMKSQISSDPSEGKSNRRMDQLKTPVSLLNEVCAKAKITPQFETSESGPPHDRVFECLVTFHMHGLALEGKGKARAKKDARQEAAKSLLMSMDEKVEKLLIPTKSSTDELDCQKSGTALDCDSDVEGNPVGELNDLCLKIKRMPPEYEDIETKGKPHESVHTVACKLGTQIMEQGRGRTKRQAKKVAAKKVTKRLTELLLSSPDQEQDGKDGCIIEKIQALTLPKSKSSKTKDTFNLSQWIADFRERSGEKLTSLNETTKTTSDPTKLLKEIADEQKFKVEYMDIDKSARGGESSEETTSILSIGIEPIAIFFSTGSSKTQARKGAANQAIEFLKIVTRK